MIRRGFWLTAGAVPGIWGYRRVAAAGRRVSASLSPGGTVKLADSRMTGQRARRGAAALAIQTYRFTRDVREGMELYMARHPAPAGSTLSTDRSTDHDALPEDGH